LAPRPFGSADRAANLTALADTESSPYMIDSASESEVLARLGTSFESARRLAGKAAAAEAVIGIHGVSATAARETRRCSHAGRREVESLFRVHETPTRQDSMHRTVELPSPITREVAQLFNALFGRIEE